MNPGPDFSSLGVGDSIPQMEKHFSEVDLMAYGAATWDWARFHYDYEFVQRRKFPKAFVDGQNWGTIFARQAMDWGGANAFIRKMKLRFRSMVFAGEDVSISGEIAGVSHDGDRWIVVLEQRATKADGQLSATCTTEVHIAIPGDEL